MAYKLAYVLCIISILISVSVFLYIIDYKNNYHVTQSHVDEQMLEHNISYVMDTGCESDDLLYSVYCLRRQLMEFYNYNLTNVGQVLSLDELKTVGGVCSHYSNWYMQNLKSFGFYSDTMVINTENYSHEVAIAWNQDYRHICLIEQWKVTCT